MWIYDVKDRLNNECCMDIRECKDCCISCEINDTCDNTCIFHDGFKDCKHCKEWRKSK